MKFDLLKWLASFLPDDKSRSAGFGPFRLPERCAWMQRGAGRHDDSYQTGPKEGRRLSDIDVELFLDWVHDALEAEDPIEKCHRFTDICTYWPLARKAGHYLYGRHRE